MAAAKPAVRFAGRILPAASGLVLWGWSLRAFVERMGRPVNPYDEGALLTDANLILMGKTIYRDFYASYGPGLYLLLASVWKLAGVSMLAERSLGLASHLAVAALAGRLAGRLTHRRFLLWPAGLCGAWMTAIAPSPLAYVVAVAFMLLGIELVMWSLASPSPWRWFAPGAAFGCAGCFRHDLVVYACACAVLVLGAAVLLSPRRAFPWSLARKPAGWACAGVLLPLVVVWAPFVWRAGMTRLAHDLFLDQIRFVVPARVLPLPALWMLVPVPLVPFRVPAVWGTLLPAAVALGFAAPAIAVALLWVRRRGMDREQRVLLALVGALSLAVVPQLMDRADITHAIAVLGPAFVLVGAVAEAPGWPSGLGWLLSGLLLLPATAEGLLAPPQAMGMTGNEHVRGVSGTTPDQRALVDFVDTHTAEGEPIFVGLLDHRRTFGNEMVLYFLANRPGATRMMEFEPNIANREEFQREMAAEIDAHARLLVLCARFTGYAETGNDSQLIGSSYLDQYIRKHFAPSQRFGPYWVWRRADAAALDQ